MSNENEGDNIPIIETYRGVGIHDAQPPERIANVVKPAINYVLELSDVERLTDYAGNIAMPPEARLFAAAKCEAMYQIAAGERRERPNVDLEKLRATVAGLNSRRWRSPWGYGSLLDRPPEPGPGYREGCHIARDPKFRELLERS